MFNIFKRVNELEQVAIDHATMISLLLNKVSALEDYLDVEYFQGTKQKPHYRKRKVVVKKIGRPRKNK